MSDPALLASALQASLTGILIKDLSQAIVASGPVQAAPDALANPDHPVAISGTVTSQERNGAAVVQTAAGPITVSLPKDTPLPHGTITVLIQPGNPPSASILSAQAPGPAQASQGTQAQTAIQAQGTQQAQAQAALPPLAVGQLLTATPLPAPAMPATPAEAAQTRGSQSSPVPPGPAAPVSGGAAADTVAAPTAILLPSAVVPASAAPVTPVLQSPAGDDAGNSDAADQFPDPATSPQTAGLPLSATSLAAEEAGSPTGTGVLAAQETASQTASTAPRPGPLPVPPPEPTRSYVVVSVEPQETYPSTVQDAPTATSSSQSDLSQATPQSSIPQPAAQAGQTITATVVAQTGTGQPLLATDSGALLVREAVGPSIGSELVLRRLPDVAEQPGSVSGQPGIGQAQSPQPLDRTPLSISRQPAWPALTQLLGVLGDSPGVAAHVGAPIPRLEDAFVQAFVRFLSPRATNENSNPPAATGTPELALTNTAEEHALDPKAELRAAVGQLVADLGLAGKTAVPIRADGWQAHQVPLLVDGATISLAQLFVHRPLDAVEDDGERKKSGARARFVVEIHPSHIGPVQLDGLLRQDPAKVQRLDLIVRTELDVPPDAAVEMDRLFRASLASTGMTGTIGFQPGTDRFVLPQSDTAPHYSGRV